jgi:RNA-directed DNA polymerase
MKSLTFNNLISVENLYLAHHKTNRGKHKFTNNALIFNIDKDNNLLEILTDLINNKYKFSKYKKMIITDNKRREIHAPIYRDKIVHHMLNNLLLPYVSTRYSKNSFACIKNRGNIHAVKFLQKQIRIAKRHYGNQARLIKIDVSKFFYTINRGIMKQRLSLVIKDQQILNVAFKIVDSFDNEQIGLPLGNLTSQTFANIYLDYIDKYITRTLGIKTYMRYADDIHIIVPNLIIAKKC